MIKSVLIDTSLAREGRRANAKLRIDKPDEHLATMFMANGTVSTRFPKDLTGLFSLDGEFPAPILIRNVKCHRESQLRTQMLSWSTMKSLDLQDLETITSIGLCSFVAFDTNWWNEYIYCFALLGN